MAEPIHSCLYSDIGLFEVCLGLAWLWQFKDQGFCLQVLSIFEVHFCLYFSEPKCMFALSVNFFFLELAILPLETVKFPFSSFFVLYVVSLDL